MDSLFASIALAGLCIFVLRVPLKQFRMGQHLARMTTTMEVVAAAGGPGHLSPHRQGQLDATFERGMAFLKSYRPHEVTVELMKNARLAGNMGRPLRVAAIEKLHESLVRFGLASSLDDYIQIKRFGS